VDAVRQAAKETGISPAQVALSWVLARPGVVSAIVGARNASQLAGNLAAADLHLDPDALATLDAASDPRPTPYPYGPFGSAQRDRTANGPEALGQLVQAHAKGDHDGVHPAR
jgi:diketogulonate reductase-like aldo/keto reductase